MLTITEIMKLLPHRYPMLLVDRVLEIEDGKRIVGLKNVSANEQFFQGHFPGNPVMPGVLIVEAMAQTAGAICALSRGYDNPPKSVLFLTIDKAKFRRPVVPGDVVEIHVTKKSRRKMMWWFRGEAKVGGQLVAEAEVGAMIVDD